MKHWYQEGAVTIPQPEPNGLFSPAESRGTYVMCPNRDGKVEPRYYEEDVEAFVLKRSRSSFRTAGHFVRGP
jgi:hypothetical protein